jgi:hypothetical protein
MFKGLSGKGLRKQRRFGRGMIGRGIRKRVCSLISQPTQKIKVDINVDELLGFAKISRNDQDSEKP